MAGLLGGVLPYLYSQGDRAKRHVRGLLSDPLGSIEQTANGLLDAHRAQQGLMARAFANPQRPFQLTDKLALGQAIDNMMAGPLGFAPAGITAWHGSPHIFNKFDSSKIGTGEGAQAYGHGLYLAENPKVAQEYQKTLSKFAPGIDGKSVLESYADGTLTAQLVSKAGLSRPEAIEAGQWLADSARTGAPLSDLVAEKARRASELYGPGEAARLQELAKRVSGVAPQGTAGGLYKVDLPDSAVAKMLDWDKPLNQQAPEVRKAAANLGITEAKNGEDLLWKLKRARFDSRQSMPGYPGGDAAKHASETLRQQGIPGIRYLDGGSRGAGQGSSNFVVFPGEESLLTILERNGVPLR